MSQESEPKALTPILALWSLGGVLGVPTLFFGIGFLVARGHSSIFGLPSSLLVISAEQTVFLGAQWALMTLSAMFHWSTLVLVLLAAVVQAWRLRKSAAAARARAQSNRSFVFALIGLCILFLSAASNLLTHTSHAFGGLPGEPEVSQTSSVSRPLALLLESGDKDAWRDSVYRALSIVGLVAAFALRWLLKAQASGEGPARFAFQGAQALGVVLTMTVLLMWPLCFGRLQLSYERPRIELRRKTAQSIEVVSGLILNPQSDHWTVVSCTAHRCQYFNTEVKDLEHFEISSPVNVFQYAAQASSR